MSGKTNGPSVLDSRAARLAAVGVALAGLAFLAWIHREDLLPPDPATAADPQEAAFLACLAPREEHLTATLEAGELTREQYDLFHNRAMAFCADQARTGRITAPR